MMPRQCGILGCSDPHESRGYCNRHVKQARLGLLPERGDVLVESACVECGEQFEHYPRSGPLPRRFCSKRCGIRNARRRQRHARRARLQLVAVAEAIDLPTLAERDGWRCHICGKRVTRKNWSIDHLVPIAAGGYDTYANAALAHWRCNAARGSHGVAQLRLEASLGVCAPIDLKPRTCVICGETFMPKSRRQKKYCGEPKCLRESRRRAALASYYGRSKSCADCGMRVSQSAGRTGVVRCRRCAQQLVMPTTQCIKGHVFSSENTYVTPDGRRQCRICRRRRAEKHREAA